MFIRFNIGTDQYIANTARRVFLNEKRVCARPIPCLSQPLDLGLFLFCDVTVCGCCCGGCIATAHDASRHLHALTLTLSVLFMLFISVLRSTK